jgi:hypothetical protein
MSSPAFGGVQTDHAVGGQPALINRWHAFGVGIFRCNTSANHFVFKICGTGPAKSQSGRTD